MKKSGKKLPVNKNITRKDFLKQCAVLGIGCCIINNMLVPGQLFAGNHTSGDLHLAKYWNSLPNDLCECLLCPNGCKLKPDENGLCHARGNRNGSLYSLVYSRPSVIKLDVIEKSPLYHYQLDKKVFSIATAGCNLSCLFCQNADISQIGPDQTETFNLEPKDVIKRAKKYDIHSINFFYTEPTIYFEYMLDIAKIAKKEGMNTFCITAGYINKKPLKELLPYLDAFVVGLKGFNQDFYKKYIGVDLEPVKETLKILAENRNRIWFEVVNLIIPGLNDQTSEIKEMTKWINQQLGHDIPIHFTRFEPAYKMKDISPTPIKTIENAYEIAKNEGSHYVYIGNIPGHKGNNTYCPMCKKRIIERVNYTVTANKLENGKCSCGYEIPGHWLS